MAKRELLMLAHKYDPRKHCVAGWFVSEKLDGQRAWWDGGITTGIDSLYVPWANNTKSSGICTGLWSRGGKIIFAPKSFTDMLPPLMPLDGELWSGRKKNQFIASVVRRQTPEAGWSKIRYEVFGFPNYDQLFADADFNTQYYTKRVRWSEVKHWLADRGATYLAPWRSAFTFALEDAKALRASYPGFCILEQNIVPAKGAYRFVMDQLDRVMQAKGEGLVLRAPLAGWEGRRSWNMLKVKPYEDAEGRVLGFAAGKVTDKGSRNLGRIGALLVEDNTTGNVFELAGLEDSERVLVPEYEDWARVHPGERWQYEPLYNPMGSLIGPEFAVGDVITFRFNGRTLDGTPKEARYLHKRGEE